MDNIPAWALANTVSAYATILSGLMALALTALVHSQSRRWIAVYVGVVVTGVATVWYHGFGETFWAGTADIGTNLLLACLLHPDQSCGQGEYALGPRPGSSRDCPTL